MRLKNVQKAYGAQTVLDGLSLEIADGEITCVLGRSGAGKTTLLNLLAGRVEFCGEVDSLPERVGYVFQENRLIPRLTLRENLQYVGGRDALIDKLLPECGLENLAERRADRLSGGEKRRAAVLRAFCVDADVILLDEPFSALDTVTKEAMMRLTHRLLRAGKKTAVFVTHDVDEALAIADKIAVLDGGKIALEVRLPASEGLREYAALLSEREKILSALRNGKEFGTDL